MIDNIAFTRAGIPLWPRFLLSNIKMTGLEEAILTYNDAHCGHVPCRPPSIAIKGVGDCLGQESSMRHLYSELYRSEYSYNPRIYGCPVEEHPCVDNSIPEFKKKSQTVNSDHI